MNVYGLKLKLKDDCGNLKGAKGYVGLYALQPDGSYVERFLIHWHELSYRPKQPHTIFEVPLPMHPRMDQWIAPDWVEQVRLLIGKQPIKWHDHHPLPQSWIDGQVIQKAGEPAQS